MSSIWQAVQMMYFGTDTLHRYYESDYGTQTPRV